MNCFVIHLKLTQHCKLKNKQNQKCTKIYGLYECVYVFIFFKKKAKDLYDLKRNQSVIYFLIEGKFTQS